MYECVCMCMSVCVCVYCMRVCVVQCVCSIFGLPIVLNYLVLFLVTDLLEWKAAETRQILWLWLDVRMFYM